MAKATDNDWQTRKKRLTDCIYFVKGNCKLEENCGFRHCPEAIKQTETCPKWPKRCRDTTCPYRHPTTQTTVANKIEFQNVDIPTIVNPSVSQFSPPPLVNQEGLIVFYWDIENVPVPKGMKPFDIVQRIREKLVVQPRLQEVSFSCFCNISRITEENQQSLHFANVRIIHIPDRKQGAADRQIMLELDRFERIHRPPATIVLISGDIDFVGKLSDLRHQAGFHVIVIHNKPAKMELKETVNAHYPWELFTTAAQQQPVPIQKDSNLVNKSPKVQRTKPISTPQPNGLDKPSSLTSSPITYNQPKPNTPKNSNVPKFICPQCPSSFDSNVSLRQHQEAKQHFEVPSIPKNETTVNLEKSTTAEKTKKTPGTHKCIRCNRSFNTVQSLNQHKQSTGHIEPVSEVPGPAPSLDDFSINNAAGQDSLYIILQGIEAIRQQYIKMGLLAS